MSHEEPEMAVVAPFGLVMKQAASHLVTLVVPFGLVMMKQATSHVVRMMVGEPCRVMPMEEAISHKAYLLDQDFAPTRARPALAMSHAVTLVVVVVVVLMKQAISHVVQMMVEGEGGALVLSCQATSHLVPLTVVVAQMELPPTSLHATPLVVVVRWGPVLTWQAMWHVAPLVVVVVRWGPVLMWQAMWHALGAACRGAPQPPTLHGVHAAVLVVPPDQQDRSSPTGA
jgi:hypothetical protein